MAQFQSLEQRPPIQRKQGMGTDSGTEANYNLFVA
jgi:hypothetical protein